MPSTSARQSKALHDSAMVRDYVSRHGGFVSFIAVGFAIATFACLLTMLGLFSSFGIDDGITFALGLAIWVLFNAWAIRALNVFLRNRAALERPQVHFK